MDLSHFIGIELGGCVNEVAAFCLTVVPNVLLTVGRK